MGAGGVRKVGGWDPRNTPS